MIASTERTRMTLRASPIPVGRGVGREGLASSAGRPRGGGLRPPQLGGQKSAVPRSRQSGSGDADDPASVSWGKLGGADVRGLGALLSLGDLVLDLLPFGQGPVPLHLDRRMMHEDVLAAFVGCDEPVAFLGVKPLHSPTRHALPLPFPEQAVFWPPLFRRGRGATLPAGRLSGGGPGWRGLRGRVARS